MSEKSLTQGYLKSLLEYNPETGEFIWIAVRKGVKSHKRAGSITDTGYLTIYIDGVNYKAHRLAFLYMTGSIPVYIDHINQSKLDNGWSNLRPISKSLNARNAKQYSTNKSGCAGVSFSKKYQKWIAQIVVNYKQMYLGSYLDIEDAIQARRKADIEYGFTIGHSRTSKEAGKESLSAKDDDSSSVRTSINTLP